MNKIILITASLIFLGFTAQAQKRGIVKNLPAKQDKALVYILRPTKIGFAIGMKVNCNDEYIGSTKGGKFLYTYLDPGNYTFQTKAENTSELSIALEGGEIYYLQQKIKIGALKARVQLEQIFEEREALKKLKKCSLSKKNIASSQ